MTFVRRHLRRGVAVWLMCHALAFSALVPRDCCAAHRHGGASHGEAGGTAEGDGAAGPAPCHETAPPAEPAPGSHCDMAATDGAACPMHQSPGATTPDCAMSGTCQAPAAALAAVLLQSAVLVPSLEIAPHRAPSSVERPLDVSARSLALPPDSPPPRA